MKHTDKTPGSEYHHYITKMQRLQDTGPEAFEKSHTNNDEFAETEKRLQVIFAESFKTWYRKRKGRFPGRGYKLLKPESMYRVEGYEEIRPESFNSVAIGENGLGDCIALQLQRDSDFDLGGNILYECLHESGEVKMYKVVVP